MAWIAESSLVEIPLRGCDVRGNAVSTSQRGSAFFKPSLPFRPCTFVTLSMISSYYVQAIPSKLQR